MKNIYDYWLPILQKMDEHAPLQALLKRCPLEIMQHWQLTTFKKGTLIFAQNQIYDEFNIVIEGQAQIYSTSRDNKKYRQASYQAGDIIGELEIFEQKPYVSNIAAITNITLLRIPRAVFLNWLALDSNFTYQLLLRFSQQYYLLAKKSAEDNLYSLNQRVGQYLLETARQQQTLQFEIHKQQISEQFAVTIRSINRALQGLMQQHIISLKNNQITLLDKEKLIEHIRKNR